MTIRYERRPTSSGVPASGLRTHPCPQAPDVVELPLVHGPRYHHDPARSTLAQGGPRTSRSHSVSPVRRLPAETSANSRTGSSSGELVRIGGIQFSDQSCAATRRARRSSSSSGFGRAHLHSPVTADGGRRPPSHSWWLPKRRQARASVWSRMPLIQYSACHGSWRSIQLRACRTWCQARPMRRPGSVGVIGGGWAASPKTARKCGPTGPNCSAGVNPRSTSRHDGRRNAR